jgi:hypothetical protein
MFTINPPSKKRKYAAYLELCLWHNITVNDDDTPMT